jgi:hypothetical protein
LTFPDVHLSLPHSRSSLSSLPPPTSPPPSIPPVVPTPSLEAPSHELPPILTPAPTHASSPSLLGPTPMGVLPREFTHIYSRCQRPPPSSPPPSSPSLLGSPPEPSSRYALRDRSTLHPPDRYGFTVAALVEPATYRECNTPGVYHQLSGGCKIKHDRLGEMMMSKSNLWG